MCLISHIVKTFPQHLHVHQRSPCTKSLSKPKFFIGLISGSVLEESSLKHFLIAPAAERPLGHQAKLGGGYSVVRFHG